MEDLFGRQDLLERRVREPADAVKSVSNLSMLCLDLRLVREILEPAAATGGIVLAGSLDPQRAGLQHLGDERLGVASLHFRHARPDGVAGKPASHEDDEAVQAGDTVTAERKAVDRKLELLISADGRGHAMSVAAPQWRSVGGRGFKMSAARGFCSKLKSRTSVPRIGSFSRTSGRGSGRASVRGSRRWPRRKSSSMNLA